MNHVGIGERPLRDAVRVDGHFAPLHLEQHHLMVGMVMVVYFAGDVDVDANLFLALLRRIRWNTLIFLLLQLLLLEMLDSLEVFSRA